MRGRPFRVLWQEDAESLWRYYRTEGDPQVGRRVQALWLLRQGRRLAEVAAVVGVHYRTVQEWVQWYRQGGLREVRAHRKAGQGRRARLSGEQQVQLWVRAAEGSFFTVQDAVAWVEQTCGVRYSEGGMYKLLWRLGCRKKLPRPLAAKASLVAQEEWKRGVWQPVLRRQG